MTNIKEFTNQWAVQSMLIVMATVLLSCVEKNLEPREYMNWMEDENNGFRKVKKIGDLEVMVQHKTVDYILMQENKGVKMDSSETISRRTELEGMQYFNVSYSVSNDQKDVLKYKLGSEADYQERVHYFSFGLEKDMALVEGEDTVQCKLYHFVRSYGMSPSAQFVIAFNDNQNKTNDKLLIIDEKIYGLGLLKFRFEASDFKKQPGLKTL